MMLPQSAWATPQIIRVDGSIFDNSGVPVTASKDVQIKAYDAASGGSLLWTSSVYNSVVSTGKFTINLDAAAGSPSLVDRLGERTSAQAIYFQIEVDSGAANGSMDTPTIVLPRIRAKGTAFALAAASADAIKGVTATTAELNYLAGVSANVQTQINVLSAGSSAGKVDKTGDSMTGALQVGANITSTGTVQAATLNSTGATASRFAFFDSSKNLTSSTSSVTDTEFGYLSGVTTNLGASLNGITANVQTQLNAKATSAALVSKVGDSMSGALQVGANITSTGTVTAATLNGTGLIANRALVTDASKNLSSSAVTDTELDSLSGVTTNIGSKLNLFTSTEAGHLSGVTAGVQTQLQKNWGSSCSAGYYLSGLNSSGNFVCLALPSNVSVSKVITGGQFAMAVLSDGTALTVGYNLYGQLGNGNTTAQTIPVYIRDTDGSKMSVSNISAGARHACALKTNGTVWCWGYNGYGGLGVGDTTSRMVPTQMSGITTAVQVSASGDNTCVRLSNGTIRCAGYNGYGGLGDGTTTDRYTPVDVSGITTVVHVANGYYSACAVLADGTMKCWGYNGTNQLGDGTTTTRYTPVAVAGLTGVTSAGHGSNTSYGGASCALKGDGTVWCWGLNSYGGLGVGDTTNRTSPTQALGITTAVKLASGTFVSCALLADGTKKCWGYNGYGGVGDGTTTSRSTPTAVLSSTGSGPLTGVTDISVTDDTVWLYSNSGAVSNGRWLNSGYNGEGELGNGSTTNSSIPVGAQTPY